MVQIEYDARLIEDIVFWELKRREERGDLAIYDEYHEQADPIYERFGDPDDQDDAFNRLNLRFFKELGFEELVNKEIEGFLPLLKDEIEKVVFAKAMARNEEGADLDQETLKSAGIKILPQHLLDVLDFRNFLQHELRHIADMLDEAFGYELVKKLGSSPTEENLIREKYKVMWDIYIDSRLFKEGEVTALVKEARWAEFATVYQKIPYSQRIAVFEELWSAEKLTHQEILDMAQEPAKLLERGGELLHEGLMKKRLVLPGSNCSLCHLPSYHFIEEFEGEVVDLVREDFPGWEPEEGACERCTELYRMRAGL